MEINTQAMSKKDYVFSVFAGLLIGLLFLPILRAAKPELYMKVVLVIVPFFLIATPFGLVIAHIISRKVAIVWQLGKFGVTGVLNFLVDLGVLTLFIFLFNKYFGIDAKDTFTTIIFPLSFYSLYKGGSFIIANINSYFWNKHWTFQKIEDKEAGTEFTQFFIVSVVGLLVNTIVASYVFRSVGPFGGLNSNQWSLIGAAMGSIAGLAWNFIGYKFIVFKK
jgi:putative flippase GtrA